MNGYQPKKTCNSCTKRNDCKKYKENKNSCKLYDCEIPKPPKNWAPPSFIKPTPTTAPNPTKQRTVLSVRDFAILMNIANMYIGKLENDARHPFDYRLTEEERKKRVDDNLEELQNNTLYQDLLRIRDKLGELNIEVETPIVEVEE